MLEVSIRVIDNGDEVKELSVDSGVDVLDIVEAIVMAGRYLPSGPLLECFHFARMTQGPLKCRCSTRGLTLCTDDHS